MTYLVVCDHQRTILNANDQRDALTMFTCKRCKLFDLKNEKWTYRDIRIYRATEQDIKAGSSVAQKIKRGKKNLPDQMDWVELRL